MRNSAIGLAILFLMVVRTSHGSCGEPQESQSSSAQLKKSSDKYKLPASLLKRFYDDSYDGFVGLMGRRNSDSKEYFSQPLKRRKSDGTRKGVPPKGYSMSEILDAGVGKGNEGDMHDFFVGLMGKRNLQTENPTNEENEAQSESRYLTKCRMKFRRSV